MKGAPRFRRFLLQCAAFALTGCVIVAPNQSATAGQREPRSLHVTPMPPDLAIVIVTLDGARWHEVYEGVDAKLAASHGLSNAEVVSAAELMPNLHAIVATHGVALGAPGYGEPISASGPNFVSLPGYAELLSGRRVTDCHDNQCVSPGIHTIVDELGASGAPRGFDVAIFSSWPEIARVATTNAFSAAVSSGRHGGSTRDVFLQDPHDRALLRRAESVEPSPGNGDFRPDTLTAELAIQHFKTHHPRFMFVGLGEPDEFGHRNDYAGYLNALRQADARIGEIDRELSLLSARGTRTALFVTADHGRADSFVEHGSKFPESARVWLVAGGSALRSAGYVAAPRPRYLADLAPTVRAIAGLPADPHTEAGTPLRELLREPEQSM